MARGSVDLVTQAGVWKVTGQNGTGAKGVRIGLLSDRWQAGHRINGLPFSLRKSVSGRDGE